MHRNLRIFERVALPFHRFFHRSADHSRDGTADSRHGAESHAHIGELPDRFVFRNLFRYVESALLLIGVALLRALRRLCLRIDDELLCFRLRVDEVSLLAQFCLGNIGILPEMQFLELFILRVAVRFYDLTKNFSRETP